MKRFGTAVILMQASGDWSSASGGTMPSLRTTRPWEISERAATPEDVYDDRREFLRRLGLLGAGALGLLWGCREAPAGKGGLAGGTPPPHPPPGGEIGRASCRERV